MPPQRMKDDPGDTPSTGTTSALPVVMDLEASGFGRNGYPIEVGYAMGDGRLFAP